MGKKSPNQLDDSLINAAARGLALAERRGVEGTNAYNALWAAMKIRQKRLVDRSLVPLLSAGMDPESFTSDPAGLNVFNKWVQIVEQKASEQTIDQQG